ncbi:MAG TPA: TlyA family RNA methyltransferase [Nitrospirae bacterium]|nr:TlyA family RNA methyltransferase [Nitrospirota bacterium]
MKKRLDILLVERGLVQSRERAKALIMEGKVLIAGVPALKAGSMVDGDSDISLKEDMPFVSRGGVKLEAAMEHFNIDVEGLVAMDVGASTGGFTDCLLQRGALKVYSVDVGYGQLDWKLRNDPRVRMLERTNMRHLSREAVGDVIEFAVMDLSFISLRLVIAKVKEFLSGSAGVVALVKPQFEVGKADVGKGGVVRDEKKRLAAVQSISDHFAANGFRVVGVIPSPIKGQKGNVEYLLYAEEC